jgi:DNA-binding response OmpR family regulator
MRTERPVLVVDDDPAVATLVATVLRRHGIAVEIALDAPAALERTRGTRFGAVLTDMTMPSMSGLDLVRAVRAEQPDHPPFLVMTAYLDAVTDARLRAQPGIASILRKPFEMERLVSLVRAALGRAAQERPAPERAEVVEAVTEAVAAASACTALVPRAVLDRVDGSLRLSALRAAAERRAAAALARARAREEGREIPPAYPPAYPAAAPRPAPTKAPPPFRTFEAGC